MWPCRPSWRRASVTATTASGAIRIGRMSNGQAKLSNGSGNIEVGISAGTTASIDVDSERGAVHDFVSSGKLWAVGPQGHGSRPHTAR
jgi:hypothetical protein